MGSPPGPQRPWHLAARHALGRLPPPARGARAAPSAHGIWLPGPPSAVYSRPPRASDGCIVLSNPDLQTVGAYMQVGLTPVIIADEIEWSDAAAVEAARSSLAP